jgi:endogenous inhibitor of DNA gyrase (YacG/DUF329 family)
MPLQAKCPICRKVSTHGEEFFPFCSERCQMIDLGKWASEEYRIAGEQASDLQQENETRDR